MEKVELENLWLKLKSGDKAFIAETAQCSKASVYSYLTGKRNIKTDLGQKVLKITKEVIAANERIRSLNNIEA